MQIRNTTTGPIFISDMPGAQAGSTLVLAPNVATSVFDSDAAHSTQLNSFLVSGAVVQVGTSEPTTGTRVGQTPGGDVTAELAANTSNDATVATIASAAVVAAAVADGKAVAAQATASAALPKSGGAMVGNIAMGGHAISAIGGATLAQGESLASDTSGSFVPLAAYNGADNFGAAIAAVDLSTVRDSRFSPGYVYVGGLAPNSAAGDVYLQGSSGLKTPYHQGGVFIAGGSVYGTSRLSGNGGSVGFNAGSADFSGANTFIGGGEVGGIGGGGLFMTSGDLLGWKSDSGAAPATSVNAGDTLTLVINGETAKTITFPAAITANAAAVAAEIQVLVRALTAGLPANQIAYSGFQAFFQGGNYHLVAQGDQANVTQASLAVTGGTAAAALKLGVANGGNEGAPRGGVGPIIFGLGSSGPYSIQCGAFDPFSGFQVYGSPMVGHNHDGNILLIPNSKSGWQIVARDANNGFQLWQNGRNGSAISIDPNHPDNAFSIGQNVATLNTGTLLVAAQGGFEAQLQLGSGANTTWTLKQGTNGSFGLQNAGGVVVSVDHLAPNNSMTIDGAGNIKMGGGSVSIAGGAPQNSLTVDFSGNVVLKGVPLVPGSAVGTILTAFFNSQASGGVFVGVPGIPASTDNTTGQFAMPCAGTLKSFSVFAKGNHNFSETVSINRNTGILASITIPVAVAGGSGGNLYNSGPLNIAVTAGDLINFAYSAANGGAQLILSAQIA